jgi:tyrosine-protein kinase Etk/Wzc
MTNGILDEHNIILPVRADVFNVKRIILLVRANWYYFLIALIFAGVFAKMYMRSIYPTYLTTTTILLEEAQSAEPAMDILEGFAVRPGAQNLENQMLILSSNSLISQAISELPFELDMYQKGLFNKLSFYPLNPLLVEVGYGEIPSDGEFSVQYFSDEEFHLISLDEGSEMDTILNIGSPFKFRNSYLSVTIQPEVEEVYTAGKKIYVKFRNEESLTQRYMGRLNIEAASREGSIVLLSLEGTNKIKDKVFLDKLAELFIDNNLEKKNIEARRIIEFIDDQLADVSESLELTENELQEFRSRNRIMDVSAQAQQIIDQAVVLENAKSSLTLERNYFHSLDEYLAQESNDEMAIAPATMGIDDPNLESLMQELTALQAEFFSSGIGERNPLQSQTELRIRNTKQSIRETLQGILRANQIALDENERQINELNAKAATLPIKERQLLGIERKFNLNNVIYTYLLQRRAEAQIQYASNIPDNELIDLSQSSPDPIAPNFMVVYLFAITMGLGIPLFLIILIDTIRNKVNSEEELKQMTQLPIVGHVPHGRLGYNTVVLTDPQHKISEAFRALRYRLEFITQEVKCPIILFSSAMPGEGKTFSAVNLASAYSLAGKKTLIVGMDMRRPTLSKSFGLSEKEGLSTYLIGKVSLENVIFDSGYENLFVIPSGPVPPNPGELASSEKAKNMLSELKKMYDYIIVDTAPIGTVADNYATASIADAFLLVVRHNHSERRLIRNTLSDLSASGIKPPNLLLNDISSKGTSYRYSYNAKYSYQSGEKKEKSKSIRKKKEPTDTDK